jgi:SAM-dependent methyltransferase
MDDAQATDVLNKVAADHGPWTSESIWLRGDTFTRGPGIVPGAMRLRQMLQLAAETCRKPLDEMRVLDLGALEGLVALEFARHGASVVAVEGREGNAAKIRAAARVAGVELEVVVADVRQLVDLNMGRFDVIFCLGLLYHLDWPSIPPFLASLAAMSVDALVIDTHLATHAEVVLEHKGWSYAGCMHREYESKQQADADWRKHPWSSIGNVESVWLTRESLANLLMNFGFSSVGECLHPRIGWQGAGRSTFVARHAPCPAILSKPSDYRLEQMPWLEGELSPPTSLKDPAPPQSASPHFAPSELRGASRSKAQFLGDWLHGF